MYLPICISMKTYSMDLRERVVEACDAGEGSREQIAKRFNVSTSWIRRLLQRRRETGEIAPRDYRSGRKAVFCGQSLQDLRAVVEEQPDATLQELLDRSGKACSVVTVWRTLERLGCRRKKSRSARPSKTGRT
jgi:transposase